MEAVFNFEGMAISVSGLTSVCMNENWSTDDIMAYPFHHAEFEYIKNNVNPQKKYDLIVIYSALQDMILKTCKSSDVLKNHKCSDKIRLPGWKDMGGA